MDAVERARQLAAATYDSEDDLEHPLEVADLVAQAGCESETQAAAVLHDLVEDGGTDLRQIAAEFGSHVAALVATLTEDETIADYRERKAEHRARAAQAGREAAVIFVADKVSNARRMRSGKKKPSAKKIGHYRATLDAMRERYPDLPLLDELEAELSLLPDRVPG